MHAVSCWLDSEWRFAVVSPSHSRGLSILKGRWLELMNDKAWHVNLRFFELCATHANWQQTHRSTPLTSVAFDLAEMLSARSKNRDDILTYQFSLSEADVVRSFWGLCNDCISFLVGAGGRRLESSSPFRSPSLHGIHLFLTLYSFAEQEKFPFSLREFTAHKIFPNFSCFSKNK